MGGCESGNASDKTINNAMLTNLSKYMARHGLAEGAFAYISDSAMVTGEESGSHWRQSVHHQVALQLQRG